MWSRFVLLATLAALIAKAADLQTFTNPLFPGGDPWVTHEDGVYYYSAVGCEAQRESICIKQSKTLTGLIGAAWKPVWSPGSPADPNGTELWAPEIHKVDGHWFIYYAADSGKKNNGHRLFVLRADTDDPLGKYSEANTDAPHGSLPTANRHWGIDPNVFIASDQRLYLVWSCTNFEDSRFPQRICLARMRDAEHLDSEPVAISTPEKKWERRGSPIQEGPVGYTRNGFNYITYSGGASWIANDYSVGVLVNKTASLLDVTAWTKSGPIFTPHGRTYGPGSVVFIPSRDGKQYWNFYHAIERLNCKPAYSCRDIRMQPMHFRPGGFPVLGHPYNPGVPLPDPSGETPDSDEASVPVH